jgi:hypothetical protein
MAEIMLSLNMPRLDALITNNPARLSGMPHPPGVRQARRPYVAGLTRSKRLRAPW